MDLNKLLQAADPRNLAKFIQDLPEPSGHGVGHRGSLESTREADHQGRHILIRTTYRIEVDGKLIPIPLMLGNDGQLHCHALPNYRFASAIELVKELIETYPQDFPLTPPSPPNPNGHGGHEHGPNEPHEH